MERVAFEKFTMEAGDCAFIPYSYLHHVVTNHESFNKDEKTKSNDDELQVAASMMFVPEEMFDSTLPACRDKP